MSSASGRGLRPGGVVRALGRLTLLVVFGFGAGLLIGVLSEEPELLAGHLRGESEPVQLASAKSVTADSDLEVVADEDGPIPADRTDDGSARRLPQVAAQRAAEAPAVVPAAPVSQRERSRRWAIQVGAFSDQRAAQKLSQALGAKGYPTQVLSAAGSSGRWRVRVQPVQGEAEARKMAAKLKRVERLPTWVLPLEGS